MENRGQIAVDAYKKMAQLCSRSEQCSVDIRRKMVTYDLVNEVVEEIIDKLKKEKFLDDERYVKAYVADKFILNSWGKVKMKHYLKLKGLSDQLIKSGLQSIDEEKYNAALIKTMKDKAKKIKNKTRFEKMGQVIRFTQSRGFEPELIHRYINLVIE